MNHFGQRQDCGTVFIHSPGSAPPLAPKDAIRTGPLLPAAGSAQKCHALELLELLPVELPGILEVAMDFMEDESAQVSFGVCFSRGISASPCHVRASVYCLVCDLFISFFSRTVLTWKQMEAGFVVGYVTVRRVLAHGAQS